MWRTTGGKHRYLLGDCQAIVADSLAQFRAAAIEAIAACRAGPTSLGLTQLEHEQAMLVERIVRFGAMSDPLDIWAALGIAEPAAIAMQDAAQFVAAASAHRLGGR